MNPPDDQKAKLLSNLRSILEDFLPIATGERIQPCDALYTYRLLLGRMPSNTGEIDHVLASTRTFREFFNDLLGSPEFAKRFRFLPGGHQLMTEANGFRLWFDSSDREMGGSMAGGSYETETVRLLRRIVKPGMVCLDIGAQIGFFTCLLGDMVGPTGKVFAFEPLLESFNLLRKNVTENGFEDRTELRQVACANRARELLVDVQSRMVVASRSGKTAIQAVAVDDVVRSHVDFCKIDVEGHEPSVVAGMTGVLRTSHPVLLTEFNQYWLKESGSSIADYASMLTSFGYELWRIDEAPSLFDGSGHFEALANFNVLAIDPSHSQLLK